MDRLKHFLSVARKEFGLGSAVADGQPRGDRRDLHPKEEYLEVSMERSVNRFMDAAKSERVPTDRPLEYFSGVVEEGHPPFPPSFSVLVGQYGLGKTEFVHQLSGRLLSGPRPYEPLPVSLDRCRQAYGHELVYAQLQGDAFLRFLFAATLNSGECPSGGVDLIRQEVVPAVQSGDVLLILDGVDELGLADKAQLNEFCFNVLSLIHPGTDWENCRARVLLTMRFEFMAALGVDNAFAMLRFGEEELRLPIYFFKLDYFSDSQIEAYLGNRNKSDLYERLSTQPETLQMLRRPLFLKIFADVMPVDATGKELREWGEPAAFIEEIVRRASATAMDQHPAMTRWNDDRLAEKAVEMYRTRQSEMEIHEVRRLLVRQEHSVSDSQVWTQVHKCPFLKRVSRDKVQFSHQIFLEYFTARGMAMAAKSGDTFDAFDELVLDVDIRRLLRNMMGDLWRKRTERSYGFEEPEAWEIAGGLLEHRVELERIRWELLEIMTDPLDPDGGKAEANRKTIRDFLNVEDRGLHPCYLTYAYEGVAVYLWHHRWEKADVKLSKHFEGILKHRLDDVNDRLTRPSPLKAHYERLVERIISIAGRLHYQAIERYNLPPILQKIEVPDTRARISAFRGAL